MKFVKITAVTLALSFLPVIVNAETEDKAIAALQSQWTTSNFQLEGKAQEEALKELIETANQALSAHPKSAKLHSLRGIIQLRYAGIDGGMGALKHVKAARADFEKSINLDAKAQDGTAHAWLGVLYSRVPGWPISFGSDKKAKKHFEKALRISPAGRDTNYLYGDYLTTQKRFKEAEKYILKALQTKPNPNRPIAETARREEIKKALLAARKNQ